jgi:hypothetical protein
LSDKPRAVIFANIEEILFFNTVCPLPRPLIPPSAYYLALQVFLSELEERQRQSRLYINTIGDVVKQHMKGVGSHYRGYCVNQSNAARTLVDLKLSDPSLRTLLDVRLLPSPHFLSLTSSHFARVSASRTSNSNTSSSSRCSASLAILYSSTRFACPSSLVPTLLTLLTCRSSDTPSPTTPTTLPFLAPSRSPKQRSTM